MFMGQGNGWHVAGSVQRGRDKVGEAMEEKEHGSCGKGGKLSVTLVENRMKALRVCAQGRWCWPGEQSGCYHDSCGSP